MNFNITMKLISTKFVSALLNCRENISSENGKLLIFFVLNFFLYKQQCPCTFSIFIIAIINFAWKTCLSR